MAMIEAVGLTKTYRVVQKKAGIRGSLSGLFRREYREVRAVDGISFTIEPGEMVAFLGPNGAGKTTTLKMLSGLVYPSGGEAKVLGFVPWQRADLFRAPVCAGHGPEEPALVGPAGGGQLRAAARDLRDSAGPVPGDARRADRASGRGEADAAGGARAFAGRADEDGVDRGAIAPAASALARRAHDRPGRGGPGDDSALPARLPQEARGDNAP